LLRTGELGRALLQFKGVLRTVGIFSLFINLLMLAPALYMLQVYDRVLPSRNVYTLLMLSLMVLGLYLFICALEYVRSLVVIRVGAQLDGQLNERVYAAAFEQTLKKPGAHAAQALNDLTTLRQFVTGQALFTFFDLPWFPIYLLVIFLFDPWLGLVATLGTLVLVGLAVLNEVRTHQPLKEANDTSMAAIQMASNSLRNAQVIEALGMLGSLLARWKTLHEKFLGQHADASQKAASIAAVTKLVKLVQQSLVLGVGAWLVLDDRISPGMMIAASILVGKALGPVEAVIGIWRQWSGVRDAHGRLSALLQGNPARPEKMRLPAPRGQISLEGVSACPPGSTQVVLRNISLAIEPGDVLCVMGASASGKSTLARLLVGIWPAVQGKVRLDGADIFQWDKQELGPCLGYLPQEVELFAGTIGENIARFGEVDSARVVAAAQMAGIHDMVLRFPQGYDTPIGEAGQSLSGGQRQRIALARALYGQPAVVVLDEPNSNLDEAGEQALGKAVSELQRQGKTVVLITHRTQALALSSKLLVLREGAVHAFGKRDEVLAALRPAAPEPAAKPALAQPIRYAMGKTSAKT
jgi:ATP-binding cassette, subfamily C, bacterial exporter for protease/lipase